MKSFVLVLALLAASVTATPNAERQTRFVVSSIEESIQELRDSVVEMGMDPLNIERHEIEIDQLPMFGGSVYVADLLMTGLSNIRTNSMSFNTWSRRLDFDLELPEILLSLGGGNLDLLVVGNKVRGHANGKVSINGVRITGEVRVSIGIFSGITINSVNCHFNLGGIKSDLSVGAQNIDFSETVNGFFQETIPNYVRENIGQINDFIEDALWAMLDD